MYRSLPTWFITNCITPFLPHTHLWAGRKFTLKEWAEGQTDLCIAFDYYFWACIITLFWAIILMIIGVE